MSIWAIADLHLSFGVPNKQMDIFGPQWKDHAKKIEDHWRSLVQDEDLVLIPGDISWAMQIEEVRPDLEWIGSLPGTKLMIKGNHDYWWSSLSKIKTVLPSSCHIIQNNCYNWNEVAIGGTRLWDVPGLNFQQAIHLNPNALPKISNQSADEDAAESLKIYQRELSRLETSLKCLNPAAKTRIAMIHYPPTDPYFKETEASLLLEKYHVDICVFGHLHNLKPGLEIYGKHHGIHYYLTACDYLNRFKPIKIL